MDSKDKREVWQRGPIEHVPALLQPVAHALLQAREELGDMATNFPDVYLWHKPSGVASVGFHLRHLSGVLDRLFTYAREEALTEQQLNALSEEGKPAEGKNSVDELVQLFNMQVDIAIRQLASTDEQKLAEPRVVGRARIPSTVIGLLFHAAEHTMRHIGQLHVTIKIIEDELKKGL